MDNSQSSDFLSESTDIFCNSPADSFNMDTSMNSTTYESLVLNTKAAFSSIRGQIKNTSFYVYFSTLLKDCGTCISQGLNLISDVSAETNINQNNLKEYLNDAVCLLQLLSDLIKHLIESMSMACCSMKTFPTATGHMIMLGLNLISDVSAETNINQNNLKEYLNDAVCLLQLLSDLIKHLIESMSMACCSMKTFPTATGHMIMLVFTHCKDSESLYGSQIINVEKQLKELFRTCHELQLTYLMVLEKHFIFDLTEHDEQDILIEALHINLKIGEIVQNLDVKTMAEQWKAYTVICEKYSNSLVDKKIYTDSTKILCKMITNNIKTALEENQEEKIVLRSLKVSSFTLKILLRVCVTFRHAVLKDYDTLLELLVYVHQNNEAYLQTIGGKSSHFINLVITNVTNPTNLLLSELIKDEKLLICLCNYNINKIRKDEDTFLGLILLVLSVIRIVIQKNDEPSLKIQSHKLINTVYNLLPNCYVWFNMSFKFKCENKWSRHYQTYGLYEHLLVHMLALAATLDNVDVLEKRMIEALLGTDLYSAMFTSNLWVLLARMTSRQLLLSQVVILSKIYQKLENNNLYADSPQKVHLTRTIRSLYKLMTDDDKMKVYNMFPIHDVKNMGLWTCLKISTLPSEVQISSEEIVFEKFKIQMQNLLSSENELDISDVINIMHLTSTCSIINREDEMEHLLIQAWMKACPKNIQHVAEQLDNDTLWYYKYIEALLSLTNSMEHIFHGGNANLVKVLHIISQIVQTGCKELKLLLIIILCKLGNFETSHMNKHLVDSILMRAISKLFQDTDFTVRNKLFITLKQNLTNSLDRIVSKIVNEDDKLQETWVYFVRNGTLNKADIKLKEQLLYAADFQYNHKCIENVVRNTDIVKVQKSLSNHFDFVDIDLLFDAETDAEPACKKAKLNTSEVEQIITRLELDTSLLTTTKENIFTIDHLNRIKNVCNKLNNIANS